MLSWFLSLNVSERCTVTAIVDDVPFVKFYMEVLALEKYQREHCGQHAQFSQEQIDELYNKCRAATCRPKLSSLSLIMDDIAALPNIVVPSSSSSSAQEGDFDNPFYSQAIHHAELPATVPAPSRMVQGLSPPSASSGSISQSPMSRLLLRDTVQLMCTRAIENVSTRFNETSTANLDRVSDSLHRHLVVGSSNSVDHDCLFFLSDSLVDGAQFLSTLRTLSQNRFLASNSNPDNIEIKSDCAKQGYSRADPVRFVLPNWAAEMLPAPSYILLLARLEYSLQQAFIASRSDITIAQIDLNQEFENANQMIQISSHHFAPTSTLENTLMLASSYVLSLPAAEIMLNIICSAEELKGLWRLTDEISKKDILARIPKARAFHAELIRCNCKSEAIVDSLLLCPIDWVIDDNGLCANMARSITRHYCMSLIGSVDSSTAIKDDPDSLNEHQLQIKSGVGHESSNPFVEHWTVTDFDEWAWDEDENVSQRSQMVEAVDSKGSVEIDHLRELNDLHHITRENLRCNRRISDDAMSQISTLRCRSKKSLTSTNDSILSTTSSVSASQTAGGILPSSSCLSRLHEITKDVDTSQCNDSRVPEVVDCDVSESRPLVMQEAVGKIPKKSSSSAAKKKKKRQAKKIREAKENASSTIAGEQQAAQVVEKVFASFDASEDRCRLDRPQSVQAEEEQETNLPSNIFAKDSPPMASSPLSSSSASPADDVLALSGAHLPSSAGLVGDVQQNSVTTTDFNTAPLEDKILTAAGDFISKDENFILVQKKSRSKTLKEIGVMAGASSNNGMQNSERPPGRYDSRSRFLATPGSSTNGSEASSWRSNTLNHGANNTAAKLIEVESTANDSPTKVPSGATTPRDVEAAQLNILAPESVEVQQNSAVPKTGTSSPSKYARVATCFDDRSDSTICTVPADSTGSLQDLQIGEGVGNSNHLAQVASSLNGSCQDGLVSAIQAMEKERERRIALQKSEQLKILEEERLERAARSKIARQAAEEERIRRIQELNRIHVLDDMERKGRQKWAACQLQQEQQSRLTQQQKYVYEIQKKLTKNIRNFNKVMSNRMDSHNMTKIAIFIEIREIVQQLWPMAIVRLYGSCITQLALPFSDIDIVIQLQPHFPLFPVIASGYSGHGNTMDLFNSNQGLIYSQSSSRTRSRSNSGSSTTVWTAPTNSGGQYLQVGKSIPSPRMPMASHASSQLHSTPDSQFHLSNQHFMSQNDFIRNSEELLMDDENEIYPRQSFQSVEDDRGQSPASCSSGGATTTVSSVSEGLFASNVRDSEHQSASISNGLQETESALGWEDFRDNMSNRTDSPNLDTTQNRSMDSGSSQGVDIVDGIVPVENSLISPRYGDCSGTDGGIRGDSYYTANWQQQQQQLSHQDVVAGLYALTNRLYCQPWAQHVNPIATAAVPVIKFSALADVILSTQDMRSAVSYWYNHPGLTSMMSSGVNLLGCANQFGSKIEAPDCEYPSGVDLMVDPTPGNALDPSTPTFSEPNSLPSMDFVASNCAMPSPFVEGSLGTHAPVVSSGQQRLSAPLPAAPTVTMLPFHLAAGVLIPVDISVEGGEHRGVSTSNFIQQTLDARPFILPLVIKVVKGLLHSAGMNVPFSGGLSSYSIFLLVCAAYEGCLCLSSEAANSRAKISGNGIAYTYDFEVGSSANGSSGSSQHETQTSPSYSVVSSATSGAGISEGQLFLHFLQFYSRIFDPSTQGIAVIGSRPVTFELTSEQKSTLGTSVWISDPLNPTKNVARPSFAFRQIQLLLGQYLATIERDHFRSVGMVGNLGGISPQNTSSIGGVSPTNSFQSVGNSSSSPSSNGDGNFYSQSKYPFGSRVAPALTVPSGYNPAGGAATSKHILAGAQPHHQSAFRRQRVSLGSSGREGSIPVAGNLGESTKANYDDVDLLKSLMRY